MIDVLRVLLKKETRNFISRLNRELKQDENYSFHNLYNTIRHLSKNSKFCVFNGKIVSGFVIPPFPSKPFLTYITATKDVNEIILIPPINSGRWLGKDEEMYNEQDRNTFLRLQTKANKKYKKIIVSSELNNCSMTRFGCAAGINHSHVNSYGELFPCDFTPLSFGNVRDGDIKTLWNNMKNTIDKPHCKCLADEIFPMIDGEALPVDAEKSTEICAEFKPDRYPDVYRKMLGK